MAGYEQLDRVQRVALRSIRHEGKLIARRDVRSVPKADIRVITSSMIPATVANIETDKHLKAAGKSDWRRLVRIAGIVDRRRSPLTEHRGLLAQVHLYNRHSGCRQQPSGKLPSAPLRV